MTKTPAQRQREYRRRRKEGTDVLRGEIPHSLVEAMLDEGILTTDEARDGIGLGRAVVRFVAEKLTAKKSVTP